MNPKDSAPTHSTLWWKLARISTLTPGGGYAMISEMETAFCSEKIDGQEPWLSSERFYKLMGAAQAIPGPIGITFGFLLGYKARGITGALISVLAVLIPPTLIIIVAFLLYEPLSTNVYVQHFFEGIFAVIPAIVAIVLVKMIKSRRWNWWSVLLVALGTGAFILWPRFSLPIFMVISLGAWIGGRINGPAPAPREPGGS